MNTMMKRLSAVCASALLLACANTPADRVAPVPAAAMPPAARNRQATELAGRGDYAGAIAIWRSLTAVHTGPESAYLYRNLGYALFLNGEYEAAIGSLEKACLLDPLNPRGWTHLGSALQKLGRQDRADMMFRQAATLERHEFTVDYALAKGSSVPAINNAMAAPPRPKNDWATRELDASSGVIDLRTITGHAPRGEAQPQAMAKAAVTDAIVADPRIDGTAAAGVVTAPVDLPATSVTHAAAAAMTPAVRLEVRNGNGVRGMAAATARRLANGKLQVVRLSNAKGFNIARTRVEYVHGFQLAASRLADRFGAATMVRVDNCWKADMRLVLGKDRISARTAAVAAASRTKRIPAAAKGSESASAEKVVRTGAPPARG